MTVDPIVNKRIIKECYESFANKIWHSHEVDKFLKQYKLPKVVQEKI